MIGAAGRAAEVLGSLNEGVSAHSIPFSVPKTDDKRGNTTINHQLTNSRSLCPALLVRFAHGVSELVTHQHGLTLPTDTKAPRARALQPLPAFTASDEAPFPVPRRLRHGRDNRLDLDHQQEMTTGA